MNDDSKKIDKIMIDIDKMLINTDHLTKQDLILIMATHIKHNIEWANYYSKESTKYYETILNQYKTLEQLLEIEIPELNLSEL